MAWFSVIKNIDMDRLKEEVIEIKDMLDDYVLKRDSAMVELNYLLSTIGQKILDGELYEDKDIREIAEDMKRKSSSEFKRIGELLILMDEKAGFPQKTEMTPNQIQEVIQQEKDRDSALLSRK